MEPMHLLWSPLLRSLGGPFEVIARSFAPVRLLGCRNRNPIHCTQARENSPSLHSGLDWTELTLATLPVALVPSECLLAHLVVPFPSPSLDNSRSVQSLHFSFFLFLSSPSLTTFPSDREARCARGCPHHFTVDDEERVVQE